MLCNSSYPINDVTHNVRSLNLALQLAEKHINKYMPEIEKKLADISNKCIDRSFYCPIRKPDGSPADIRNDSKGRGGFGESRGGGNRLHTGTDYEGCEVGQPVFMPIKNAKIFRKLYAYSGDTRLTGVEIFNGVYICRLFYMDVDEGLIGKNVDAREPIGKLQDIREKYGPKMKLHLHAEIYTKSDQICY
jgi:hypothetical protein